MEISKKAFNTIKEERIRIFSKGVEYLITELKDGGIEICVQNHNGKVAIFPRVANTIYIKVVEKN